MTRRPDVLQLLDRLLANTPESSAFCRPLPRGLVESIADEIRTLRQGSAPAVQATAEASAPAHE